VPEALKPRWLIERDLEDGWAPRPLIVDRVRLISSVGTLVVGLGLCAIGLWKAA
jgi:hypothetical protein